MIWLAVALAGGAGAWCRFRLDALVRRVNRGSVPLGILVVNVTGSLALGLLVGWLIRHGGASEVALVAGTGFLGGYTTFSTAAIEVVALARDARPRAGALLGLAQVVLGLSAAALGLGIPL